MHWPGRIARKFYLFMPWNDLRMRLRLAHIFHPFLLRRPKSFRDCVMFHSRDERRDKPLKRSTDRRFLSASMAILFLLLALPHEAKKIHAGEMVDSTTSETAKNEAIRAIPFAKIESKYRPMVRNIVQDATLYRRLPTCVIDCHPELFTYAANNPDVLVAMWQALGISQIQLERTGADTFRLLDQAGTKGTLRLVEHECDDHAQNRFIMVAEGGYDGKPIHLPVKAQCVLLLRSGSIKETNGRPYVAARLDTFFRIDRASMQLFAKVVHPWVGKMADQNFVDTMHFVGNLSHTAQTHPSAIGKLTDRIEGIRLERKEELLQIARQCQHDHSVWQISRRAEKENAARYE